MSSHKELTGRAAPEILPWVGAGNPAKKPNIRVVDLDSIDESDLLRLREPPYPELEELVESLKQLGQTTPMFVRPKADGRFELIAGYRRRAALAKMNSIQGIVRIYENLSDTEAYEIAISENAERGDLTDWEKAQACLKLQSQGRTQDDIAGMFHWKDGRQVRNYVRLARSAPAPVRDALQTKRLQMTHALALLRLGDAPFTEDDAQRFTARAIGEQWSVRRIEQALEEEVARRAAGSGTAAGAGDDAPIRYREFKSGAVHLSARIDPQHPESFEEIADQLRKALRVIAKYKKKQGETSPGEAPGAENGETDAVPGNRFPGSST